MKAGFWIAPEGAESPVAILPIGGDDDVAGQGGGAGPGARAALASREAADLIARCPRIAALLPALTDALERQSETAPGLLFDLAGYAAEELKLLGEVMGEGEVAATVALPDGVVAQVQESVLAGLWRVRFEDAGGTLLADYAEVSAVPQVIRRAAAMTLPALEIGAPPEGAMNVMPLLAEIRDRVAQRRPGDAAHEMSLTQLPMSEADTAFLQETLGAGPVRIVSRGYGTCRIQACAVHGVWSVQFFNASDAMLLDKLEICDVPVVACAAEEDFRDSAERLREIEEAYFR